jgi:tetratricopeptide (TPR) repeat protein
VAVHKAGELDPDQETLNGLARCAYAAGDLDRAIALTEQYLGKDDLAESARRWQMVAKSVDLGLSAYYLEAGRYQEMLEVGDAALQYSSGNPSGSAFDKGTLLLDAGRAQEALAHADGMLERYPDARAPFYSLRIRARAMAALGDLDGARAAVKELYAFQDRHGPQASMLALRVEAEIALAENDAATALEALDGMYELGIYFGGLFYAEYREIRARAHRMAGQLEEAAAVHNELLRVYGGHALSHYELGLIYEEMDRPQDAEQEFARFLEMWSNADEGLPQLADARERLSASAVRTP